ncbi:hypothetical protein J6590_062769 [Homalodisca vitripennis]|nr:hypothetical protein J6590_062769 [Homalodisca vitripennis]
MRVFEEFTVAMLITACPVTVTAPAPLPPSSHGTGSFLHAGGRDPVVKSRSIHGGSGPAPDANSRLLIVILNGSGVCNRKGTRRTGRILGSVCRSLDIRNSVEQFNQLEGCQVIEGFLQIVLIDRADPNEYDNLTFPELREVTGYILLYRVHGLRSLAKLFPNLSVIRGNELFSDYALVVFEMLHLQELGLSSLTDILRGGVYFVKNPMLCYIDTIDWDLIAKQSQSSDLEGKKGQMHFIRNNKRENECPICPRDCPLMVGSQDNHLCWSPQHCQKVCPESCGNRACDATGACCHDNCLGGCHVNNATNCFSCRGVLQDGHCMSSCPKDSFKYLNRRCISEEECYALPKPRLVIQTNSANQQDGNLIPDHPWKPFNGECILTCPAGYLETNNSNRYNCKLCQGKKVVSLHPNISCQCH